MPMSLLNFKSGTVLLASPAKDILEELLLETDDPSHVLDASDAWSAFQFSVTQQPKHADLHRVKKPAFIQSFKLFVTGGKGGSDCYHVYSDPDPKKNKHTAKGWKLKAARDEASAYM